MPQFPLMVMSSNLSRSRCSSPSTHEPVDPSHENSAPLNSFTHSAWKA